MKTGREKRGQFIIIAVMLTAVMIVSIGALMHNAITYYKHEPWEEYSTLIGDIEINSRRLVELSLASYTNSSEPITSNLAKWENDLIDAYPSSGITLTSSGAQMLSSSRIDYRTTKSSAQASFTLDIQSIGLEGYAFNVLTSVTLKIGTPTAINSTTNEIIAVVKSETGMPVTDLSAANFKIENATKISVGSIYDKTNILEYKIVYDGPTNALVEVWDQRGIHVVASQT